MWRHDDGGRGGDARILRQDVEIEEKEAFDFGLNARQQRSRFAFALEDDIQIGVRKKMRQERTNPRDANRVQEFRGC